MHGNTRIREGRNTKRLVRQEEQQLRVMAKHRMWSRAEFRTEQEGGARLRRADQGARQGGGMVKGQNMVNDTDHGTGNDRAGQDREGRTGQGGQRQGQGQGHDMARQGKAKQGKANQDRDGQGRAGQG